MFKFIPVFALLAIASAAPGFLTQTHHDVVQPAVLAKTAVIDTSASSAITHQSFTNLEKKVPLVHTFGGAPLVKTVAAAPLVHTFETAPVVKTVGAAPLVHTFGTAPVVKTVAAAPLVHAVGTAPVVHTYAAGPVVYSAPVVHSAPLVKTLVSSPVAYHSYH